MFCNIFNNKDAVDESNTNTDSQDDSPLMNLSYTKVSQTIELKKRQQEEILRAKYKILKDKTGVIL